MKIQGDTEIRLNYERSCANAEAEYAASVAATTSSTIAEVSDRAGLVRRAAKLEAGRVRMFWLRALEVR